MIAPNRLPPPSHRTSISQGPPPPRATNPGKQTTLSPLHDGGGANDSRRSACTGGEPAQELDLAQATSSAWTKAQLSDILLSDAPPPLPPPPPGLEELQAKVVELRQGVDSSPDEFLKEFQERVRGNELVVGSVDVEEVEARERQLLLERLADAREQENIYRSREQNLVRREQQARERLAAISSANEKRLAAEKRAVIEIAIARERALASAFTRARVGLVAAIRAQAGRVREVFGELRPGERAGARRYRVEWTGVPQPVEVRLHCLRVVRDRLPHGLYVILTSMADRLGGRSMRWVKSSRARGGDGKETVDPEGGGSRPHATRPVSYGGRYNDLELRFDQSVYQVCPSKTDVRPGNVMVFELFRLAGNGPSATRGNGEHYTSQRKGEELDEDASVGWCVLPLADSRLRIVRGGFRIPMIRGEPTPSIYLHATLEKLIADDLEGWLGNLYLDVRHLERLGRDAANDGRYDVELDHVRKVARLSEALSDQPQGLGILSRWRWSRGQSKRKRYASHVERDVVERDLEATPGGSGADGTVNDMAEAQVGADETERLLPAHLDPNGTRAGDRTRRHKKQAQDLNVGVEPEPQTVHENGASSGGVPLAEQTKPSKWALVRSWRAWSKRKRESNLIPAHDDACSNKANTVDGRVSPLTKRTPPALCKNTPLMTAHPLMYCRIFESHKAQGRAYACRIIPPPGLPTPQRSRFWLLVGYVLVPSLTP